MHSKQILRGSLLAIGLILLSVVPAVTAPAPAPPEVQFDGDTPLVPVDFVIAEGTGIALGGASPCDCGTEAMSVNLPADVTIAQVLFYWYGALKENTQPPAGAEIGARADQLQPVAGVPIGGPAYFFTRADQRIYFSAFRADITELARQQAWLRPGQENTIFVDLSFAAAEVVEEGAGLLVIYDDGRAEKPQIFIREGLDLAFFKFSEAYRRQTEPAIFSFNAAPYSRDGRVYLMIASEGDPNYARRPNDMNITVGEQTYSFPCFGSCTSLWWDSHDLGDIPVPSGVDELTAQVISRPVDDPPDELGASLAWIVAALLVPQAEEPDIELTREAYAWSYTVENVSEDPVRVVNIQLYAGPEVAIECPESTLDVAQVMTCTARGPATYHARTAWVYAEAEESGRALIEWIAPD